MSIGLRLLAALAMVALIGAGCSDGSAEKDPTGTGSSKPVTFDACMRENGVTEFPDSNAAGDQEFVEAIESLDQSSAAWKKAMGACKDLLPAGLLGAKASSDEMRARLEFAQCMRENGVEDFPDPTRDGPLIDTNRIPSAAGRGARDIPGFDAAVQTCSDAVTDRLGLGRR